MMTLEPILIYKKKLQTNTVIIPTTVVFLKSNNDYAMIKSPYTVIKMLELG